MGNRLEAERSPYLRQHADNPVDWYPWGDEAFAKARAEDKPVFLSVGYSACHWCHVMAHESFEDEETASYLNDHFVSIKVDREERPDVDSIYMDAVQLLTGRGGWPMSAFLTPDGMPFYGGTYFPPTARHGLPAFRDVLERVEHAWDTRRDDLREVGVGLRDALTAEARYAGPPDGEPLDTHTLDDAVRELSTSFNRTHGGWGTAPKFPQPAVPEFLLRRHADTGGELLLSMVVKTLDAMMRGGMYDHLGGGFHRYSTDDKWLVPHFEKMLYDNAQLPRLYVHAWQVTGDVEYRRIAEETLDYLVREMRDGAGGFYSAQDADTEGEEGRYFVWTPDEVTAALAADSDNPDADAEARLAMVAYGITPGGNFEGKSVLFANRTPQEMAAEAGVEVEHVEAHLRRARLALKAARDKRVAPGLDDKVLAGWNGLALAAFAEAARVLDREDYVHVAQELAEFLLREMRTEQGRMLRSWQSGSAGIPGFLEDHAFCADGLLELYRTTFDQRWLVAAHDLTDTIVEHFADPDGGFFDTADDHEQLLVRPKSLQDGAVPSGGSVAADVLARMAEYTGNAQYAALAERAIAAVQPAMAQVPLGFARWLSALAFVLAPPRAVAVVGEDPDCMLEVLRERYDPDLVVAAASSPSDAEEVALLHDREPIEGETTAYVCRHFVCEKPVSTAQELVAVLES